MKYIYNIINKGFNIIFNSVENSIRNNLYKKCLSDDIIDLIICKSIKYNNLFNLYLYLNNPTISYEDLLNESDLIKLFTPTLFEQDFIEDIINISGTSGTITFGKGEIALIIFINNSSKYNKKGDIIINNTVFEIKRGKSQISESKYTKRIAKSDIFLGEKSQHFISEYNPNLSHRITWIQSVYETDATNEDIIELIHELYPGLEIDFDLSNYHSLNDSIGLALVKNYLKDKILLFIDKNNKFICIKDYDEFKSLLNTKIKFSLASDLIPRCELIF